MVSVKFSVLEDIRNAVIKGEPEAEVKRLTQRAIDDGYEVKEILDNGLVAGIDEIGRMWKEGQAFIPEVLLSSKVMHAGMDVIKHLLVRSGTKPTGKVVIGTVKGDAHEIGKSLVSMMMEAFGFEVHDLGVDVAPEKFVEAANAQKADIVAMSALLTTMMPQMGITVKAIKEAGLKVTTIVGGAPVTQEYADSIGADGYAPDAISAVDKAKELVGLEK